MARQQTDWAHDGGDGTGDARTRGGARRRDNGGGRAPRARKRRTGRRRRRATRRADGGVTAAGDRGGGLLWTRYVTISKRTRKNGNILTNFPIIA